MREGMVLVFSSRLIKDSDSLDPLSPPWSSNSMHLK